MMLRVCISFINIRRVDRQLVHPASCLALLLILINLVPIDGDKFDIMGTRKRLINILTKNPLSNIIGNSYSFFYNFPKKNLLYENPPGILRNSTTNFIAWYQFPRNLPPYGYIDNKLLPNDFFSWGLPGNTLPLGNWDPFSLHLVMPKVVKKYRESELKHGRLAMLATVGCIVQEAGVHPLHPEIGGLAITHMKQLALLPNDQTIVGNMFSELGMNIELPGLDYYATLVVLSMIEVYYFHKNWYRWRRNEFNHQFDTNIGLGHLKEVYENGNYDFDPLHLMPDDPQNRKEMIEFELNHCRLGMIAFVGILVQEYVTGQPILTALRDWIETANSAGIDGPPKFLERVISAPAYVIQQLSSGEQKLGL